MHRSRGVWGLCCARVLCIEVVGRQAPQRRYDPARALRGGCRGHVNGVGAPAGMATLCLRREAGGGIFERHVDWRIDRAGITARALIVMERYEGFE